MKKALFTIAIMLASLFTIAQVPQGFSYQAVVRDKNNAIVANKSISLTISIIRDNITLYTETHTPTTNANGLFSIEIGNGSSNGNFAAIDWSYGNFFLETDSDYGTTTTQLLSVPFAMYAAKAGNVDIDLSSYATQSQIPTALSQLYNDAGYITASTVPTIPITVFNNNAGYITANDIPTIPTVPSNVSAFKNDAGYITASDIPSLPEIPTVPSNVSAFKNDAGYITASDIPAIPTVPSYVSAFKNDAGYITASDIPTIPTVPSNVSAFKNDAGYITANDIPIAPSKVSELENDMVYVSKSYLDELMEQLNNRIGRLEVLKKEDKTTKDDEEKDPTVQYVDLGLPSGNRWATCNIGADSPEKYGEYFAWGEVLPKETYTNDNYKYKDNSKYNGNDGLTILEQEDDVASVLYGTLWSIPTKTAWQELLDNCFWVWTSNYKETNKSGYIVYRVKAKEDFGKRNAKSTATYDPNVDTHIFLPLAGWKLNNSGDVGTQAYYWTSWIMEGKASYANVFGFNSGSSVFFNLRGGMSTQNFSYSRYNGFSVRAIRKGEPNVPTFEDEKTYNDGSEQINGITVEYVDFGLPSGNLWAKCNLGASSPDLYGNYYAWGETTPNKASYDLDNYIYYDTENKSITKYKPLDGLTILQSMDDAVTMSYGAPWATPSKTDWEELLTYGYWVKTGNYNNINKGGYIVYRAKAETDRGKIVSSTSTYTEKDAHIFLPYTGYVRETSLVSAGNLGEYWTSWVISKNASCAYTFGFGNAYDWGFTKNINPGVFDQVYDINSLSQNAQRCFGLSIRPVRHKN